MAAASTDMVLCSTLSTIWICIRNQIWAILLLKLLWASGICWFKSCNVFNEFDAICPTGLLYLLRCRRRRLERLLGNDGEDLTAGSKNRVATWYTLAHDWDKENVLRLWKCIQEHLDRWLSVVRRALIAPEDHYPNSMIIIGIAGVGAVNFSIKQ